MGVPVKGQDSIIFTVWSSTANTFRLNVAIRPLRWPLEDPYTIFVDVTGAGDRSSVRAVFVITDPGEIESAQVTRIDAGSSVTQPGIAYCQGNVSRAAGAGGNNFLQLVAGYVRTGTAPTYPGQIKGPWEEPGQIRSITTADPAANAEIANQICPAGARWEPKTFSVQLVQGITQTPLPTLKITGAGGLEAQIPITTVAIGASSTALLTWGQGLVQSSFTAVVGDEFHTAPIPRGLYLLNPDHFETGTDGIGANTNYGAAVYQVEEWIQPV